MPGIYYALADFVTGGPILDLPVMQGASWATQLNRGDSLSCSIDLNDPDALALDLRAATEPKKTILLARTEDDVMLAWGLIDDDREWNETNRTLAISAKGIESSWLGAKTAGPAAARTSPLTVPFEDKMLPNPALDAAFYGYSFGTIGKKLVQQALGWPGAPTWFSLPADQAGTRGDTWPFSDFKRIGKILADLTDRINGPDFAFDLSRAPDGLSLICTMRHGSEATPRIGSHVGVWPLAGTESPISDFTARDNATDLSTASWAAAGRSSDSTLMSRYLMDDLIDSGYPPLDYIDTSHGDVVVQDTLDDYAEANAEYARSSVRSVAFTVEADAAPRLGEYRPGDRVTIDVGAGHPYLTSNIEIRLTSLSGDEEGKKIKIGCEVIG